MKMTVNEWANKYGKLDKKIVTPCPVNDMPSLAKPTVMIFTSKGVVDKFSCERIIFFEFIISDNDSKKSI